MVNVFLLWGHITRITWDSNLFILQLVAVTLQMSVNNITSYKMPAYECKFFLNNL